LLLKFAAAFSSPTFERWLVLLVSAILTTGRRTVSNLLRTAGATAPGHSSSYHRVLSKRVWSLWSLARVLATVLLETWVPHGIVALAVDDTVDEHRGKKVYGKACHRDAVRSTHSFTAYRWGHKWVVLSILVKFPFASRPWALPVLVALYRSAEWDRKHRRRHRTPVALARQLAAVLMHWFPDRAFRLTGDGGFATHELASFAGRHRRRLALVSRFRPDANLHAPAPPRRKGQSGRPRVKGRKTPSPQQIVARSKRQRLSVSWYGGGTRRVEVVSSLGYWFKAGRGLVPVRWVFVHDLTGTHRDEYFFTTDVEMTPAQIVEAFTGRWSLEVTFGEMRAYVGLETTRGRTEHTVLRTAPCLFGLYSVIAVLYATLPIRLRHGSAIGWAGKTQTTFSDAITTVRRWIWRDGVFATGAHTATLSKLPQRLRTTLLYALAPAA
jgi:hypothetical protein